MAGEVPYAFCCSSSNIEGCSCVTPNHGLALLLDSKKKPYNTIQIIQEKNDNKFPQLETFTEGPELGVTIYGYMDPDVGNIKLNKKQVEELRDNLNSWLETH